MILKSPITNLKCLLFLFLAGAVSAQADTISLIGAPPLYRYSFEQTTGNTTTDSGPNANTGTISAGTAVYGLGRYGHAFVSTNTGQYFNLGTAAGFNLDGASFSITAWINITSSNTANPIVSHGSVFGGTFNYQLSLNGGTPAFEIYNFTSDIIARGAFGIVSLNAWHLIVATYDATGGKTLTVYLDGKQAGTTNNFTYAGLGGSGTSTIIGNWSNQTADPTHYFNGSLDEVRIYNRLLTAAEIQKMYFSRKAYP